MHYRAQVPARLPLIAGTSPHIPSHGGRRFHLRRVSPLDTPPRVTGPAESPLPGVVGVAPPAPSILPLWRWRRRRRRQRAVSREGGAARQRPVEDPSSALRGGGRSGWWPEGGRVGGMVGWGVGDRGQGRRESARGAASGRGPVERRRRGATACRARRPIESLPRVRGQKYLYNYIIIEAS